jgi:pimeloyl-ACP methyl ester carboxylesterase
LQAQDTPNSETYLGDISLWKAAFPSVGVGGCGSRLPKKLIIKDRELPTFSFTFEGGKRMGGIFETDQCFGLAGYVTRQTYDNSGTSTNLRDTVTVTFSRPLTLESFRFQTETPASYLITLNDSVSRIYQPSPRQNWEYPYAFRNPNFVATLGFRSADVANVTKLSIKSLDSLNWAFGIDNVRFTNIEGGGGTGEQPPASDDNPVVFVPGVAGSELVEQNVGVRWLSTGITSLPGDLDALELPGNRNIYATDVFRGQLYINGQYPATFYQSLLGFLKLNYGNTDQTFYNVGGIPERRTTAGCDWSQDSSDPALKPKIFVFAYDWRKSNVETALALKDYVGCVKIFYPNKKVDIVAHSMGGLVSRRYVLDNPGDHGVEKLITIATPFLGAPKAIHALETGVFIAPAFGASKGEWFANMLIARKLKNVMGTFPGPLQLLPSDYYFSLNHSNVDSQTFPYPFSVRRFPWSQTVDYNYSQTRNWLNERREIRPGDISHVFHQSSHGGLQDDWRQDTSNVRYYHIYGQQRSNLTVGKVRVLQNTVCNPSNLNCQYTTYYEPIPTNGDGTVPLLSSRRISFSENINLNKTKRYFADAKTMFGQFDDTTEHTKLNDSVNVQATLLKILKNVDSFNVLDEDSNNPVLPTPLQKRMAPTNETSSFYVSLHNVEGFSANGFAEPSIWGASGINGMQAVPMGDKSAWIAMPATDSYKVSFFGNGTPVKVQIIKGLDYDRVEESTRYIDLNIPENAVAELTLSPSNNPILFYDSNGDDTPDTFVTPTLTVNGENAKDIEPPVISFDYQSQGTWKIVTLTATDNLSGVRKIYYSLDGQQFTAYTNPVSVGGSQNEIYVFAEDNNYNRTGIAPIDIVGASYSIGNRVWSDINNDGKIDNNSLVSCQRDIVVCMW